MESLGPLALVHAVVVLASAAGLLAITAADRGCPADAGAGPALAAVVLAWTLLTAGGGGVALVAALLLARTRSAALPPWWGRALAGALGGLVLVALTWSGLVGLCAG